jgi:hypothetical protein
MYLAEVIVLNDRPVLRTVTGADAEQECRARLPDLSGRGSR